VIELPEIQIGVTHVVLHKTRCPRRGRFLKAELPAEYRDGYGPRLTALIGELSGPQRDSRSAVQAFCTSVLGVPISRGAIQRAVDRVSEAIKPQYEAIAEKTRAAQVAEDDARHLRREGRSLGRAHPFGAGDVSFAGRAHLPSLSGCRDLLL
jgi:transposase